MIREAMRTGVGAVGRALREPEEFTQRWQDGEESRPWPVWVALLATATLGTATAPDRYSWQCRTPRRARSSSTTDSSPGKPSRDEGDARVRVQRHGRDGGADRMRRRAAATTPSGATRPT